MGSNDRAIDARTSGDAGRLTTTAMRAIVVFAVILSACGSDAGTGTTDTSTSTTAPTTTSAPATTTTSASTEDELFGWLRSFETDAGVTTIGVDKAELLTGEEALAAARKAGEIGPNEELPNDFYIDNADDSIARFTISPDVAISLQACYENGPCVTTASVDLAMWSVLLGGEEDPGLGWSWYGGGGLPYIFTVRGDQIVEVEEFYLP